MTLPASGSISLSQVNTELGYSSSAQISLNDSAVRTLFGKSSGAISMSDGYGKANQFAFTISSNQTNADLATLATTAGWNGTSKLIATIGSGVYISSNSTGTPALTISSSFPGGVELINNGYIVGMGGAGGGGGDGGRTYWCGSAGDGGVGSSGGLALSVSATTTITNNGTIAGGGGGGGGGAGCSYTYPTNIQASYWRRWSLGGSGGGGGRSSNAANSSGGAAGGYFPLNAYGSYSGNAGNVSAAGAQQSGYCGSVALTGPGYYGVTATFCAGYGGSGGSWGASGSSGSGTSNQGDPNYGCGGYSRSGGSGGSAGGAVSGNSNITWIATGTRLGSIS